jgi:hypothetical protein
MFVPLELVTCSIVPQDHLVSRACDKAFKVIAVVVQTVVIAANYGGVRKD